MEITELLNFIKNISWQVIALLAILLLRKEIRQVFLRLQQIKIPGVGEYKFYDITSKTDDIANRMDVELSKVDKSREIKLEEAELVAISNKDVLQLIKKGSERLKRAAHGLAVRHDIGDYQKMTEYEMVKKLAEEEFVDKNHCELFWQMLLLANKLATADKKMVSMEIAERFLFNAKRFEEHFSSK